MIIDLWFTLLVIRHRFRLEHALLWMNVEVEKGVKSKFFHFYQLTKNFACTSIFNFYLVKVGDKLGSIFLVPALNKIVKCWLNVGMCNYNLNFF